MKLFFLGVFLTISYFLSLFLVIDNLSLSVMSSWNELGDFLAGAFSPVAFLWLVLGYVQQQKELQQNTYALNLQAEELRNAVEQYQQMVLISKEQLSHETKRSIEQFRLKAAETKPEFHMASRLGFHNYNNITYTYFWSVYSNSREARNFKICFYPKFGIYDSYEFRTVIAPIQLPENLVLHTELPEYFEVHLTFDSILGVGYELKFFYKKIGNGNFELVDTTSKTNLIE
ncbi:hypothetical protein [Enterobacter sp. 638]|uniref:Uncharacterized protein n=1 Tax=Enterobacter sp. (strain 638) TaxID=399742 RepID=A0A9J9KZ14_ENT38|nr:hypothetical protein [Enterobacter sp. 638]ABP61274.1 hypothetical protein Ent638_2606 [Enterobacter sp. 638]